MRRGVATALVVLIGLGLLTAMLYAFIRPLADQVSQFADDLPGYVEDARAGEGTVGDLVERFNLEDYVEENQDRLQESLSSLGAPALDLARSVFNGVIAGLTILVLTILMLLQGPRSPPRWSTSCPSADERRCGGCRRTRRWRCRATCSGTS